MRNLSFCLTCCLLLTFGCTKKDNPSPSVPPRSQQEQYAFVSIVFHMHTDSSRSTLQSTPIEGLISSNQTSVEQKVVVHPSIKESSSFKNDQPIDFSLKTRDTIFVQVPTAIGQDNQAILGQATWPFPDQYFSRPADITFRDTVSIPSGKTLRVSGNIIYRVLEAAYTAVFKGVQSGKVLTIEGQWEGTVPFKTDIHYALSEN